MKTQSPKASNLALSEDFGGHFCHYKYILVKSITDFNTLAINQSQSEEIGEKQLSVFGFRRGQISPLMRVALYTQRGWFG